MNGTFRHSPIGAAGADRKTGRKRMRNALYGLLGGALAAGALVGHELGEDRDRRRPYRR